MEEVRNEEGGKRMGLVLNYTQDCIDLANELCFFFFFSLIDSTEYNCKVTEWKGSVFIYLLALPYIVFELLRNMPIP